MNEESTLWELEAEKQNLKAKLMKNARIRNKIEKQIAKIELLLLLAKNKTYTA
jgi:hypothetical protein